MKQRKRSIRDKLPEYKANIIFSFRHYLLGIKGRKSGASYKIIGSLFIWRAVSIKRVYQALFIDECWVLDDAAKTRKSRSSQLGCDIK